mgnify:CR=1 FL=1
MPYLNVGKLVEVVNKFIKLTGAGEVVPWSNGVDIKLPVVVPGRHVRIITSDTRGNVITSSGCQSSTSLSSDVRYIVYGDDNEWVGLRVYGGLEELLVRVYGSSIEPVEYSVRDPRAAFNIVWLYSGGGVFYIIITEQTSWKQAYPIC